MSLNVSSRTSSLSHRHSCLLRYSRHRHVPRARAMETAQTEWNAVVRIEKRYRKNVKDRFAQDLNVSSRQQPCPLFLSRRR